MLTDNAFLILLLVLSLAAGNRLVAAAAGLLLLLDMLDLGVAFDFLSERALDWGLVLLLVAILAPAARGSPDLAEVGRLLTDRTALFAVIGGILATRLQGGGLNLLETRPDVILGLLIGTLIGVLLFGGIPVGPLTGAGLAAVLLWFADRYQ